MKRSIRVSIDSYNTMFKRKECDKKYQTTWIPKILDIVEVEGFLTSVMLGDVRHLVMVVDEDIEVKEGRWCWGFVFGIALDQIGLWYENDRHTHFKGGIFGAEIGYMSSYRGNQWDLWRYNNE